MGQCGRCGKKFKLEIALKKHSENCLKVNNELNEAKVHKCDICEKLFARKNVLKEHFYNVHGKSKELSCETCGEMFYQKIQLRYESHFEFYIQKILIF